MDEFLLTITNKDMNRSFNRRLTYFVKWCQNKNIKVHSILEITPKQFREYFTYVNDTKDITKNKKERYRGNLKRLIYYIILPMMAEGKTIKYNYEIVFSNAFFKFSHGGFHREEKPLSRKDVLDCLEYFKGRSERDFILVSILAYTGMRVGGVVNIEIGNINLEERMIWTQEKVTSNSAGKNVYFIPEKFVRILKTYVSMTKKILPDQKLLFPIKPKTVRYQLRHWKDELHPHLFRDAINSRWMELTMDEGIRAILLNQTPGGVNSKHYLKNFGQNYQARRDMYDKFFPY